MQVRAAVLDEAGAPFRLRDVELREPGPGEVLVRVLAAGMCHTDLSVRGPAMPVSFPIALGHEDAGIVEASGPA